MILNTAELQHHPLSLAPALASAYHSSKQTLSPFQHLQCALYSPMQIAACHQHLLLAQARPHDAVSICLVYIDATEAKLVSVGLAQARPNYIYAPYVRLTVNFHLQHGQDGRSLRSPLRATQILATDSFKRQGNRTKRSGHYNLSPRQGYRHRKKEYRQLIFLHVREFHRTLSEVVSRSLLYTMPTGTPLRRTLSNTTASENLLLLVFSPSGSMGPIATVVY